MKKLNLEDYQSKIDYNAKYSTCQAVYMALWLIIEKDSTLTNAVNVSCSKRDAKKSPVTKMLREILPAGYLQKKAAARMPEELKGALRQVSIEGANARRFEKNRL